MFSTPHRAAIYTRVSSEDQLNGHSLEAQERLVRQFCEIREWQVVKIYGERGRSGKSVLRPEFQAMLLDAEAGLFDVLVVHKMDRFSRSIIDTHTYIKKLDSIGVALVSATEPFDLTTPMGKAFLGILAIFAELYLDNLAAEITKGKKQRALKGFWNGTLSWGYRTPKRLQEMLIALNKAFKTGELLEAEYTRQADLLDDSLSRSIAKPDTAAVPDPFNAPGVQFAYSEYSSVHIRIGTLRISCTRRVIAFRQGLAQTVFEKIQLRIFYRIVSMSEKHPMVAKCQVKSANGFLVIMNQ
jgi:DNA invertase Pin-like site-specific DNA recombinase